MTKRITLERTFVADVDDVWDLWTTKEGFESWWGPVGFRVEVRALDLRVGGALDYAMIAHGAEQIAFMQRANMPVSREHRITFTEIEPHRRLGFAQRMDFVPGVTPYTTHGSVDFQVTGDRVRMVLTLDAMHDDQWTERARMGWEMQLSKLEHRFQKG